MKKAGLLAVVGLCLWLGTMETTYFILGPEVARLPQHQRIANMPEKECLALAADFRLRLGAQESRCEKVSYLIHTVNLIRNAASQLL